MVRKILLLFVALIVLSQNFLNAQFSSSDIQFWTGTGSNEVVLIIDFNDGSSNDCWAWGYRFAGSKTAEEMLIEMASADNQLEVNLMGGFLNDILYSNQSGIAASPYYWSTFSGTNLENWVMNMGLSSTLDDGDWFGCSYTDVDSVWNPIHLPENPMPAPTTFSAAEVAFWVGAGTNEAVLVVDFNDSATTECWAWGYRFDGNKTA